ncbi:MAG: nitrous oxide reductase family maturation protein NosD [Longimicrobiales bacterium]|nr:nitrous oxide reductase family maturation protein NosD [Longimicrobiales bacterium]
MGAPAVTDAPAPPFSLAAAVAAAAPHDTVRVPAGVHREGLVTIDRPLTLLGAPGAVLDGEGRSGLLLVAADSVTVTGLTFRNTGTTFADDRAALQVESARFCTLSENLFEDTFFGIYLANSGDCRIESNTLTASGARETSSGNGIHLWYSTRVVIRDNVIRGHRDGIYFEFVESSEVTDNLSEGNLRYGLHFMFSDDCAYRRNRFALNGAGVAVMYTQGVVMEANDFDDNRGSAAFGLLMKDITDSRIEGNRFRHNTVGIHAEGLNRVEVRGNDFIQNGWAIQLMANSNGSRFEGNNFVGNTFDLATNSRRAWSGFAGNYWDRYTGYDLDRDGSGDVPFQPVRLFSLLVEQNEPALVLERSFLVDLLDLAESVIPLLTPKNLEDDTPALTPVATRWSGA